MQSVLEKSPEYNTIAYTRPFGIRFAILTIAAIKHGLQGIPNNSSDLEILSKPSLQ